MITEEQLKELLTVLKEKEQKSYKLGVSEEDSFSKGYSAGISESINVINQVFSKFDRIIGRWVCPGCGEQDLRRVGECKNNYYLRCTRCNANFCVIAE